MRTRTAAPPTLRFDRVGLSYGHGADILTEVSFELRPGAMTFLTGPSGAGKSTLLKLSYLALKPDSGKVQLFGEDTAQITRKDLPAIRRRIGVVFQEFRLLDHLTAYENVALPLRIAGEKEKAYESNVRELLRWVGLGDRQDARPPTLSGGEKQRVAIARAVVVKPDLILADEPTGNIDLEMGDRLMRLFSELNRNLGTTLLIATHDLALVQRLRGDHLRIADGMVARAPALSPLVAPPAREAP